MARGTLRAMRRLAIALVAVVVVVGAVGAVGWWRWSRPVAAAPAAAALVETPSAGSPSPTGDSRTFRLAVTGRECAGVGPLCLGRDLPASALLVVTTGADGSVVQERRFSTDHAEAQTFAAGGEGLELVGQRQDITFAGMRRDERDVAAPAALLYPARLAVGDRWVASYRLRRLDVRTTSHVARAETVDVGGVPVDTFVIEQDTRSSGPFDGDEHARIWWAPTLGLAVRRTVERSLSGGFTYRLTLDERLESTTALPGG